MQKVKNIMLIFIGLLFFLLGVIGLFVPVMPTTIFLILSGICFINSSELLYVRLIKLKYFGPHIENYIERRVVTKKIKMGSAIFLIISSVVTVIFIVKVWYLRLIPLVILIIFIWHLSTLKAVNTTDVIKKSNKEFD